MVFETDGTVQIGMQVLCESTKPACDQLVRDFEALNERTKQSLSDAR